MGADIGPRLAPRRATTPQDADLDSPCYQFVNYQFGAFIYRGGVAYQRANKLKTSRYEIRERPTRESILKSEHLRI